MKKFKISAFKRYKIFYSDSRNDKDMVKTKKVAEKGGFFSLTVVILTICEKLIHKWANVKVPYVTDA